MKYAIAGLLILAALLSWGWKHERTAHQVTMERYAEFRATTEAVGKASLANEKAVEARWGEKLKEATQDAETREKAATVAAGDLRAASASLRLQLAAARARSCPGGAGATVADPGTPAEAAPDLLADLQRRLDEAIQGVAGFADAAHSAGLTCERSWPVR